MDPRQPPENPRHTNPETAGRIRGEGQHGGTGGAREAEGAPPNRAEAGLPEVDSEQELVQGEPGPIHQVVEKLKYIATRTQF